MYRVKSKLSIDAYDDWQSGRRTVKERIAYLYKNECMSDVSFVVNGSRVPVHKFVLSTCSSVFYTMFHGYLAEQRGEIEITDCESIDYLLEFLRFIYTDEISLDWDNTFSILYLSKKYMIPSLTRICCDSLRKLLTKENVLAVLQQSVKFDEQELLSHCLEFIHPVINDVVNMEAFLYLDLNTLKMILKEDNLQIAEINLFIALKRWCDNKIVRRKMADTDESRKKIASDAVNLIRFPCISAQDFATHCVFSGLLTLEQIRDLFYLMVSKPGDHTHEIINRLPFSAKKRIVCPMMLSLNRVSAGRVMQNWSYKGAADALDFTVNKRISLCGISIFGDPVLQYVEISLNSGEWIIRPEIKIGMPDSGPVEGSYRIMFSHPVRILPFKPHTLIAIVKSPQSKFAKYNTTTFNCEHVVFTFNSSNESGNGTSSTRGQFPEFLYKLA
eukprot:gene11050-12216_t